MRFSADDSRIIARCIQELEARTQAEVALVVRKHSGSYRDISYLFGAGVAFLALAFALFSPWEFPPHDIPLPLLAIFWVSGWLIQHSRVRVWLATRKRRRDQVKKAAFAAFFEKKVFGTHDRMGILLYHSHFEREAEIVADTAALAKLEPGRLEEFRALLGRAAETRRPVIALGEFLRSFGVYLGHVLPWDEATQGAKLNEIDDGPELDTDEDPG
jgi:uncharacterized membrane protein